MTVEVAEQKQEEMEIQNQDGKVINQSDYSCQILLEKTSLEAANDKSFPTDARLIWYVVDGVEHMDLTRCGKDSRMFDMYYESMVKVLFRRLILDLVQPILNYGEVNLKKKAKENERRGS